MDHRKHCFCHSYSKCGKISGWGHREQGRGHLCLCDVGVSLVFDYKLLSLCVLSSGFLISF